MAALRRATKSVAGVSAARQTKSRPNTRRTSLRPRTASGWMQTSSQLGVVGYLRWVAGRYPRIFCGRLGSVLELQELEIGLPPRERPTVEEFDEVVRAHIGLAGHDQNSDGTRGALSAADPAWTQGPDAAGKRNPLGPTQKANEPINSDFPLGVDRSGRLSRPAHAPRYHGPEGVLRIGSCRLPRPTAQQRGLAARRAWEERQRAGKRRRAEQEQRVTS